MTEQNPLRELDDAISNLETMTAAAKYTREGRILEILEKVDGYVDAKISGIDIDKGRQALRSAIDDLLWM